MLRTLFALALLLPAGTAAAKPNIDEIENKAIAAAKAGQFEKAQTLFGQVLKARPNSARSHSNLGSMFLDWLRTEQSSFNRPAVVGRLAGQAAEHFEASLTKKPPPPAQVLLMLGRIYVNTGQPQRATVHLRRFLKLDGLPAAVRQEARKLLIASQWPTDEKVVAEHDGTFKAAVSIVKPHLQFAGDDRPVWSQAGGVASDPVAKAALTSGAKQLERVLALNPVNWSAAWFLGLSRRVLGDYPAEHRALGRAFATNPEHADVAREYMASCLRVGAYDAAVAAAKTAARSDPADPGLQANVGLALMYQGKIAQALEQARAASARAPADPVSKKLVGLLESIARNERRVPTTFPPR